MNEKQYNIIYYHGMDSFLSDDKRSILEKFGKVSAPTYDYRKPEVLQSIADDFDDPIEDTIVIGSSFGGYLANMFSIAYDVPCLLFNPALPYRSIDLDMDQPFDSAINSLSYFVIGKEDEIIKCEDNLRFIDKFVKGPKEVMVEYEMAHRVPVELFEKHVKNFFQLLAVPSPG